MKTLVLTVMVVMAAVSGKDVKAGTWYYDMVASTEQPFLGQGWFTVRHTWSDDWSVADNRDETQSWMSGVGRCNQAGAAGCSSAYRSWAYSHRGTYSTNTSSVTFYLDHHIHDNAVHNMVYLVNGVCHTATNRASRKSGLSRVVDYGVLGSSSSQSAWGTCGKYSPWGYGISCP